MKTMFRLVSLSFEFIAIFKRLLVTLMFGIRPLPGSRNVLAVENYYMQPTWTYLVDVSMRWVLLNKGHHGLYSEE